MKEAFRCLVLVGILAGYFLSFGINCKSTNPLSISHPQRDSAFTILFPFFSADGKKVYFFGRLFGLEGSGLYEVDTAGGKARLLAWDSLAKSNPELSPDGQRVAYQAAILGRELCCAHVWVMNIDGTGPKDYTPWGGYWEGQLWSPDGKKMLMFGPVEINGTIKNQVLLMNEDGSNPKIITGGETANAQPHWSADGSKIFYVSDHVSDELASEVYVMNADGSAKRPVDSTHNPSNKPCPSPTRNELGLSWSVNTEQGGVYLVNYDTTPFPAGPSSFKLIGKDAPMENWSPDGNYIAVDRELFTNINDLYVMDRAQFTMRRITKGFEISTYSWSRDSKRIVFESYANTKERNGIFIVDVEQSTVRRLTITR